MATEARELKGNIYCGKKQVFEYSIDITSLYRAKGICFWICCLSSHKRHHANVFFGQNCEKETIWTKIDSQEHRESMDDTAYCVCITKNKNIFAVAYATLYFFKNSKCWKEKRLHNRLEVKNNLSNF